MSSGSKAGGRASDGRALRRGSIPEGYAAWIAKQKANFEQLLAKERLLGPAQAAAGLAGTSWKLVRFQESDETTLAPDDPSKYTLVFGGAVGGPGPTGPWPPSSGPPRRT